VLADVNIVTVKVFAVEMQKAAPESTALMQSLML
jgi:hypothetical protein